MVRARLRRVSQTSVLVSLLAASQMFCVPASVHAAPADLSASAQTETVPTLQELEHGIADRLKRVEEFKFIEQEAARLGVKAWLFGGTAAGYAHYVKWDMQREKGDKRFQKDRFDYDYTNIYRSTQDLDIVIEGNAEQAQRLQSALAEKYPHLQGSKSAWEVRLLTQDMGDKQAILNNPDFMNQHTDSNSTGLIEITKPEAGESVVRDVRDWRAKEPYFLKDVHDGALHYYFSPAHETTKFAREGRNPPILSAIRYLTKAFQYELKLRPEDLDRIKKVIDEFDPKRDTQNSYVANWIEKNGKKLFQNAVNIEYAWDTLEQLGLRKKLQAIKNDAKTVDSLAWWMNKEPLRTSVVGQGSGKTAKELGLDVVGHETRNFLAYESITRAHTGDSNVLVSRDSAPGEAAIHGDGFYTKAGREGARGFGLTIRFRLDPHAREGVDFFRVPQEDYVVIKNKAAIRVIPESLNIGPVEYFEMLAAQEAGSNLGLQASDRGVLEKLKRRIGAKLRALSQNDIGKILTILRSEILKTKNHKITPALEEWFTIPVSTQYPEIAKGLLKEGNVTFWVAEKILGRPEWQSHPEWVEAVLQKGDSDWTIVRNVLSKPHWQNHPEWVELILNRGTSGKDMVSYALTKPHWQSHPKWAEWVDKTLAKDYFDVDSEIVLKILHDPASKDHPEWVEDLIKRKRPPGFVDEIQLEIWDAFRWDIDRALRQPHWKNHPDLRRMSGGEDPTVDALTKYFEKGGTSLRAPVGSCIHQKLDGLLR
ncbi:MAG: hypothetical protein ACJ763_19145 [Bdellovibrionia bacterium]